MRNAHKTFLTTGSLSAWGSCRTHHTEGVPWLASCCELDSGSAFSVSLSIGMTSKSDSKSCAGLSCCDILSALVLNGPLDTCCPSPVLASGAGALAARLRWPSMGTVPSVESSSHFRLASAHSMLIESGSLTETL